MEKSPIRPNELVNFSSGLQTSGLWLQENPRNSGARSLKSEARGRFFHKLNVPLSAPIVQEYPELEKEDVYQAAKYGAWLASEATTAIA